MLRNHTFTITAVNPSLMFNDAFQAQVSQSVHCNPLYCTLG